MQLNLQTTFTYYNDIYCKTSTDSKTLTDVFNLITGTVLQFRTGEIRRLNAEGRKGEADKVKMSLPAIAISAHFPTERDTKLAGNYTSFVLIDLDELQESAAVYMARCRQLPFVSMAYVSARGKGIHLFIRVDTSIEHHAAACQALQDGIEACLSVTPDAACRDITRTSLLCYDPEAYFNPDAATFHVPEAYLRPKVSPLQIAPKVLPVPVAGSTYRPFTDAERLTLYLDKAAQNTCWMRGARHGLMVRLAHSLNRAGFAENEALGECLRRYAEPDFDEREITQIIRSVYTRRSSEHGTARRSERYFPAVRRTRKSATSAISAIGDPVEVNDAGIDAEMAASEAVKSCLAPFPKGILDHLPNFLRTAMPSGLDERERDMLLLALITQLSSVMVHVEGTYHGEDVFPMLFTSIVAKAGSGKGIVESSRAILNDWQAYVYQRSEGEVKEYLRREAQYNIDLARRKHSDDAPLPDRPKPVIQQVLALNGDTSKAKLIEQLVANKCYPALLQESEIGILVDAVMQDYSHYTFLLNQIGQFERIGNASKSGGVHSIEHPLMSMLLTGTAGAFARLIPSAEDGLFSRFLCYMIPGQRKWKDLTDKDDTPEASRFFHARANTVLAMGLHLEKYPTFVTYQGHQRQRMNRIFARLVDNNRRFGSEEGDATILRLGNMHFRICMTLTGIRKYEAGYQYKLCKVTDEDFDTATQIVTTCLQHALVLATSLKKDTSYVQPTDPNVFEKIYHALPEHFRTADFLSAASVHGFPKRTLEREMARWITAGAVRRESMGKYCKNPIAPADEP